MVQVAPLQHRYKLRLLIQLQALHLRHAVDMVLFHWALQAVPGQPLIGILHLLEALMVGTGTTFTTPAINTTTAYYAAAEANISGNVTSGLGALTSTSTAYNPFSGTYGGEKSQFLFTASELLATGLRAGNITALALNLSAIGGTYNGFNIEMGTTALSDFATPPDIKGGLTLVYTSASITPTVGVNTYTLSTPFNWDGSSNIIVSLCWSNNNTSKCFCNN